MRLISGLMILVVLLLSSCNKNDEPLPTVQLPIAQEYLPVNFTFDVEDKDSYSEFLEWNKTKLVVNSADEMPDDPLGFSNAYSGIDFNNYTLLLFYLKHRWQPESCSNIFYRNRLENRYEWSITFGVSDVPDEYKTITFSRYAILVKKLPADSEVVIWYGLSQLGGGWD